MTKGVTNSLNGDLDSCDVITRSRSSIVVHVFVHEAFQVHNSGLNRRVAPALVVDSRVI